MSLKDKVLQLQQLMQKYIVEERAKAETLRDWLLELKNDEVLSPIEDTLTGWEAQIDADIQTFLGES